MQIGIFTIYVLARLFLFLTLIIGGWCIAKKKYANHACISIAIVYSLIEGLRWERGVDYMHYYYDIVTALDSSFYFVTKNPEPLYWLFIKLVNLLGIPYWMVFVTYSALLIIPVLLICKKIPSMAIVILGLFYAFTVSQSENLIRQYLAASFVLFAFNYYLEGKKNYMIAFLIIAPLFHYSELLVVVPFYILTKYHVKISPIFFVTVFILCFFFWNNGYFQLIADNLTRIFGSGVDNGYIENADVWFSDAHSFDIEKSRYNIAHRLLFFSAIIIFGYSVQKKYFKLQACYYFSYFALLFQTVGGNVEIYNRFFNLYVIFVPFLIGYTLLNLKSNSWQYWCLYSLSMIYVLYGALYREIMPDMGSYAFIWDR